MLLGQILRYETDGLPKVSCALFDLVFREEDDVPVPTEDKVFSILFTTQDTLDNGFWRLIGQRPVIVPQMRFPYETLRGAGFVGAKTYGSGIVKQLANAFVGLRPWDRYADPEFLDKLLVSADKKPKKLIYKKDIQG